MLFSSWSCKIKINYYIIATGSSDHNWVKKVRNNLQSKIASLHQQLWWKTTKVYYFPGTESHKTNRVRACFVLFRYPVTVVLLRPMAL